MSPEKRGDLLERGNADAPGLIYSEERSGALLQRRMRTAATSLLDLVLVTAVAIATFGGDPVLG
jgi:hypothetical protein